MNFLEKNESLLPYYRSQVTPVNQKMSPIHKSPIINDFKQSLVPDLSKKFEEYEKG